MQIPLSRSNRLWDAIRDLRSRPFLKNFAWNIGGTITPLAAAAVSIPILYRAIGIDRFGILSLAWVIIGYFSFFDLGLGRALTQAIAQKLGTPEEGQVPSIIRTGMIAMMGLGLAGALIAALLAPWLAGHALKVPEALRGETMGALLLLSISIPIVIVTTGFRGILEAHQRFDIVNWIRAPMGVLMYLGPLAVISVTHRLPTLVLSLLAVRLISLVVYMVFCLRLYPDVRQAERPTREALMALLSYGGWMTVSNLVGPLLLYLGRLLLAVMASAQAVAWFSTPYDMVINALIVPAAITTIVFPLFARDFMVSGVAVRSTCRKALLLNLAIMVPPALVGIALAHPLLSWWLDADFAEHSYRAAQLLIFGVVVSSAGHIYQTLVQACGRPDLTAKLHLLELALYVPYLWLLISRFAVEGAAIAWVIRVTISTAALAGLSWYVLRSVPVELRNEAA